MPRLLKQAQRDLLSSGIRPNGRNKKYEVYLVDAHLPSAGELEYLVCSLFVFDYSTRLLCVGERVVVQSMRNNCEC